MNLSLKKSVGEIGWNRVCVCGPRILEPNKSFTHLSNTGEHWEMQVRMALKTTACKEFTVW